MKDKSQYVRKQVVKAAIDRTRKQINDKGREYAILIYNGVTRNEIIEHDHIVESTYYIRLKKSGISTKLANMSKDSAISFDTYRTAKNLHCLNTYYKARHMPIERFERGDRP